MKSNYKANLKKEIDYNMDYHLDKFGKWIKDQDLYEAKGKVAKKNIFDFDFNENSNVLEVGCGVGQITAWIKDKSCFELNQKLYPLLQSKGFKTYKNIKEVPNDCYDEVVMSMVLEHIENPVKFINDWKQKLKIGGKIRLNLPCAFYHQMQDMNSSHNGHYFAWGFPDINYLLNRCGFKVLINKKVWRKGIDRFINLYRWFGFNTYYLAITLAGMLFTPNDFDIVIVAERIK